MRTAQKPFADAAAKQPTKSTKTERVATFMIPEATVISRGLERRSLK